MPSLPSDQRQTIAGIFLLGLGALAVFDFWFPGILLLVGGIILLHAWLEQNPLFRPPGWLITAAGFIFWLQDIFNHFGLGRWFPLLLIALAAGILFRIDLQRVFSPSINEDETFH